MSKIIHNKKNCIGCGSCLLYAPNYWEMDDEGKADLKRSKENKDVFILDIFDFEVQQNMDAAQNCPVNSIQILDEKGNILN